MGGDLHLKVRPGLKAFLPLGDGMTVLTGTWRGKPEPQDTHFLRLEAKEEEEERNQKMKEGG